MANMLKNPVAAVKHMMHKDNTTTDTTHTTASPLSHETGVTRTVPTNMVNEEYLAGNQLGGTPTLGTTAASGARPVYSETMGTGHHPTAIGHRGAAATGLASGEAEPSRMHPSSHVGQGTPGTGAVGLISHYAGKILPGGKHHTDTDMGHGMTGTGVTSTGTTTGLTGQHTGTHMGQGVTGAGLAGTGAAGLSGYGAHTGTHMGQGMTGTGVTGTGLGHHGHSTGTHTGVLGAVEKHLGHHGQHTGTGMTGTGTGLTGTGTGLTGTGTGLTGTGTGLTGTGLTGTGTGTTGMPLATGTGIVGHYDGHTYGENVGTSGVAGAGHHNPLDTATRDTTRTGMTDSRTGAYDTTRRNV